MIKIKLPRIVLTRPQKLAAVVVAVLLGTAGFYRFVVTGMQQRFHRLAQLIHLEEARLERNVAVLQSRERIETDYARARPYFASVGGNDKQILARLLQEIESIVRKVNGSIVNLSPRSQVDDDKLFTRYGADIRLEMNSVDMLRFLRAIEESELLINLDTFTISAKDEAASILRIEGVVNLTVVK
jgi:hypothetical protein